MQTDSRSTSMTEELHATSRLGWLRAAVLGANDGILSTSSLIIGVASAHATQESILLAGISSLVAGAISMAAGEYVSVSSQADSEKADLTREKKGTAQQLGYRSQRAGKHISPTGSGRYSRA